MRSTSPRPSCDASEIPRSSSIRETSITTGGSASFAAGLVEAILIGGAAAKLTLSNAPDTFARYVTEAARDLSVTAKFDLRSSDPQLAAG